MRMQVLVGGELVLVVCTFLVGLADYAAVWITLIRLFTTVSISSLDFNRTFILRFWSTGSWNLNKSVEPIKKFASLKIVNVN